MLNYTQQNVLIIAPHIDDETIGCWSVLTNPAFNVTVAYLYELTPERVAEAKAAAADLQFTPLFAEREGQSAAEGYWIPHLDIRSFSQVYVPSRRDWHADHKKANAAYRTFATAFYSVDMAQGKPLGAEGSAKLEALNALYPSQRSLWDNDAKYYLFEDIQALDYDAYTTFELDENHTAKVLVSEAEGARSAFASFLSALRSAQDPRDCHYTDRQLMDVLLSKVTRGRVVVTNIRNGKSWEAR